MGKVILDERFDGERCDDRLQWRCPPSRWSVRHAGLVIHSDAETDYWQQTHYGFRVDNGHFLGMPTDGDFILSTKVRSSPVYQYDQAGLMVRYSPEYWLKTSVEYEPDGPDRLGVVVTQAGYSDWSTQHWPANLNELELRVRKEGDDFTVEYLERPSGEPNSAPVNWTQMRVAHLQSPQGSVCLAGLYVCSPKGVGFRAEFDYLRIERP